MPVSPSFLLAFALTLVAMAWLALTGGRGVRGGADFSLAGRKAGSWHVAGAIMGTLVGGASTIGTAQLAFLFGLSAWWFTLGAGIACLLLGLFLAGPLRAGEAETIPQFISRYHGERARVAASLFSSLGMFVHIVAQLLACGALLSTLFGFGLLPAALVSAGLIGLTVFAGGMQGAGTFGLAKLFLLYLTMVGAGVLAWRLAGGWEGLRGTFPVYPWFSLFGYGVREGVNDLLSMLVGVISTQTYLQAVFSARDRRAARAGALWSALLIPPLGLFGIAVGLYMRQADPFLASVKALPAFLQGHLPPLFAGAAFAALLIAAVGTGAGLTLGVATTLRVDVLSGPPRRSFFRSGPLSPAHPGGFGAGAAAGARQSRVGDHGLEFSLHGPARRYPLSAFASGGFSRRKKPATRRCPVDFSGTGRRADRRFRRMAEDPPSLYRPFRFAAAPAGRPLV